MDFSRFFFSKPPRILDIGWPCHLETEQPRLEVRRGREVRRRLGSARSQKWLPRPQSPSPFQSQSARLSPTLSSVAEFRAGDTSNFLERRITKVQDAGDETPRAPTGYTQAGATGPHRHPEHGVLCAATSSSSLVREYQLPEVFGRRHPSHARSSSQASRNCTS